MRKKNFIDSKNNSENTDKITIKACIIVGNNRNSSRIYSYLDNEGKKTYSGFFWDIWTILKSNLSDRYEFKEFFVDDVFDNNEYIYKVADGELDIIIGQFFPLKQYEQIITYTQPIIINSNAIIHKKKDSTVSNIGKLIWSARHLVYYIIGLGLVLGLLLYIFDRTRTNYLYQVQGAKNKSKAKLIRSFMTGISTMFGESGFLTENVGSNWKSFLLSTSILAFSFVGLAYIQSLFTNNLAKLEAKSFYNPKNIPYKDCIGFNSAEAKKLERYGINIKYYNKKEKSLEELIQEYINNETNYSGVISNYIDSEYAIKKFSNLVISKQFGAEPVSFVINQKLYNFIEDINKIILKLRQDLTINNICKKYYSNFDPFVCALS